MPHYRHIDLQAFSLILLGSKVGHGLGTEVNRIAKAVLFLWLQLEFLFLFRHLFGATFNILRRPDAYDDDHRRKSR